MARRLKELESNRDQQQLSPGIIELLKHRLPADPPRILTTPKGRLPELSGGDTPWVLRDLSLVSESITTNRGRVSFASIEVSSPPRQGKGLVLELGPAVAAHATALVQCTFSGQYIWNVYM